MQYKAYLFDLNGTMINDMSYHIKAWYRILNDLGANLSIEQVKRECYGKNHELLERVFPERFSDEEKDVMSYDKERQYQAEFKPHLRLLPGLAEFLEDARSRNIKMAIGSAAIRFNIDFVIDNLDIRDYFQAIVSADEVRNSKPDPETWLLCAEALEVEPADCLVFEDAPKGVEAAARAGMKCHVLTTMHEGDEFTAYDNIIGYSSDFQGLSIL